MMLLTIVMKVGLVMKISQIVICMLLKFVIITGHTECTWRYLTCVLYPHRVKSNLKKFANRYYVVKICLRPVTPGFIK